MVVLKRHMDQNNVVVQTSVEETSEWMSERASERQSKWTYYTHFTTFWRNNARKVWSDFVIWHRFQTDFMHCHTLHIFAAYPSNREREILKYFCTIYQEISRGYVKHFSSLYRIGSHRIVFLKCIYDAHTEIEYLGVHIEGKSNQAWNKHEAWVCQGEIKLSSSW